MKLHSNIASAIATGVVLFTAWGYANSPEVHQAWLQDEVARKTWNPVTVFVDVTTDVKVWFTERFTSNARSKLLDMARETAISANAENVTWEKPEDWKASYNYNGASYGYGPGTADSLPAFPGCEGAGCGALQQPRTFGRRVCRVSNLASSGAGSFQACLAIVEADSNTTNKPLDIIAFDTAGAIYFSPTCSNHACSLWRGMYIMGQSAPGPVVLYNWPFKARLGSEDVVIRGIAHRGTTGQNAVSWSMKGRRVVNDHISVSHGWQRMVQSYAQGPDYGPFNDSSYMSRFHSWSKIFLSYKPTQSNRTTPDPTPNTMFMFNSQPRSAALLSQITLTESVVFGGGPCPGCAVGSYKTYRVPNFNADSVWLHGNLIYMNDAGNLWSSWVDGAIGDATYNEYRSGAAIPSSPTSAKYWPFGQDSATLCQWIDTDTLPEICADASMHYHKNHVPHIGGDSYADTALSQDSIWRGSTRMIGTDCPGGGTCDDTISPPLSRKRETALPYSNPFGFDTVSVSLAQMNLVLDSAGAGWQVDSFGAPWMNRDTVDRRARAAVQDTVMYRMPGDTNTDSFLVDFFPNWSLDVDPKCSDADNGGSGDGICDAWENTVADTSLQPTTIQASGYSTIELAYAGGITNIDTTFGGPIPSLPADDAFRGAEGYGKAALAQCRDSVYYGGDGIHGNADDWPLRVWLVDGSVRETPEAPLGIRTIVEDSLKDDQLDVIVITEGGYYHFDYANTRLIVDNDCVYFTGAAAQGEGAAFMYDETPYYTTQLRIGESSDGNLNDVLIRDFKMWGDSMGSVIFTLWGGEDLYFDHLSFILGGDGAEINANRDTVQRVTWGANLMGAVGAVGEPELYSQMFIMDGFDDDPVAGGDRPNWAVSILRSAFITASHRMPALTSEITDPDSSWFTGPWELINLMTYDAFSNRMAASSGATEIDWIGSWFGEGTTTFHSRGEISVEECYDPASSPCADNGPKEWVFITPGIYASDLGYYEAKVLKHTNYNLFTTDPTFTTPLPDSMRNSTRQATSTVTDIWSHANVPDSLFGSNPRHSVRASRILTCGGTYEIYRDSTDQWVYDRYVNNSVGNATTTIRGWGSTVYRDSLIPATACADTDQDGLPNAFETWSGVGNADSLIGGYFAIEHYLNGDSAHLDYLLEGGAGGSPGGTRTYSGGRYAFLFPIEYVDTTLVVEADTYRIVTAEIDSVPDTTRAIQWITDTHDSAIVLTCDSLSSAFQDSSIIEALFPAWGFTGTYPWAVDTAGLGCGG
jgi:hypothetical protein